MGRRGARKKIELNIPTIIFDHRSQVSFNDEASTSMVLGEVFLDLENGENNPAIRGLTKEQKRVLRQLDDCEDLQLCIFGDGHIRVELKGKK